MTDFASIIALGFVLGMRHATDADHVIAITTLVTRQQEAKQAALAGLAWGIGHTLTIMAVGAAIVLFNITIPQRVGLGLELSVGVMLVVLGMTTLAGFGAFRPSAWRARAVTGLADSVPRPHRHGDYIHTHPVAPAPAAHPHTPDQTPLAMLDRRLGGRRTYEHLRPLVIGVVHGLAGSAAISLLVLAFIREPAWAVAYLGVFGVGTVAGMMLITMSIASAFRYAGRRSNVFSRRLGMASGLASVGFGVLLAYQIASHPGFSP